MAKDVEDRAGTGGGGYRRDDEGDRPEGLVKALGEISLGRWDGHLGDIQTAIWHQEIKGRAGFKWVIDVPDLCRLEEEDLTADEGVRYQQIMNDLTGERHFLPQIRYERLLIDPQMLTAVVRARLESGGMKASEALEAVKKVKINDLIDGVSFVEVNPDPKEASG